MAAAPRPECVHNESGMIACANRRALNSRRTAGEHMKDIHIHP